MPRERMGSVINVDGKLYALVTYISSTGKRKSFKRRAESRSHAREIIKELLCELDDGNEKSLLNGRKTFSELAEYYLSTYAQPAQYDERQTSKIAGLRDYKTAQQHACIAKAHFGNTPIKEIGYGDILRFKRKRLVTPTRRDKPRSVATVHRELAVLRRMLNIAQQEGWIKRNPFNGGDPLIKPSEEHARERILTPEEEEKVLADCNGRRAHLRPILIAAFDTGMRQGELFKLLWEDVDFSDKLIHVVAFNTKVMRERWVGMTDRLYDALQELYAKCPHNSKDRVFGIKNTVKTAFNRIKKITGLTDVRFHDLRHTTATRLVGENMPLHEVGRLLGHTQANTTYRYVNANIETARRAAEALNKRKKD